MAQQISITMPDGLYDRLQAVKDRFNVSRVCQEAIELEVKVQEWKNKIRERDGDKMNEVIERLRAEKEAKRVPEAEKSEKEKERSKKSRDLGWKHGMEAIKTLSLEQLQHMEFLNEHGRLLGALCEQNVYDNLLRDIMDNLDESDKDDFSQHDFIDGWYKGVLEAWAGIKDKL